MTSILEVLWVEDQIHQRAAFNRTPSSRPDPLARAFVATLRGMGRGFPQSPVGSRHYRPAPPRSRLHHAGGRQLPGSEGCLPTQTKTVEKGNVRLAFFLEISCIPSAYGKDAPLKTEDSPLTMP